MPPPISPLNIAAAALFAQLVLVTMVFVAVLVVGGTTDSLSFVMVIIVALITIGSLLFSDQFAPLWRPLLANAQVNGLRLTSALMIMFVTDLLLVFILVAVTGGSVSSPFTPVYFLIPVLAIFLRESPGRVVSYAGVVVVLFTFTMVVDDPTEIRTSQSRRAYWFVSLVSFMLATVIGLVTRP